MKTKESVTRTLSSLSTAINSLVDRHCTLNPFIKLLGREFPRMSVGSPDSIEPSEQVTVVPLEEGVMHVMVCRCSKADTVEELVPRKRVLGVNQRQPVRIQTSKGHVRPYIAMYQIRGGIERY